MHPPYPGSAQMPQSPRQPAPAAVHTAVKIMYLGAAASLIGIVVDLTTLSATKSAIEKQFPNPTAGPVTAQEVPLMVGFWLVIWLIGPGAVVFLWRRSSSAFFTGTQS
jgi:hypothetical protein